MDSFMLLFAIWEQDKFSKNCPAIGWREGVRLNSEGLPLLLKVKYETQIGEFWKPETTHTYLLRVPREEARPEPVR